MSSLTALLLLAALQATADPPLASVAALLPPVRLTAEEELANERSLLGGPPAKCNPGTDGEIVVCARKTGLSPRLPFPDQRAEPGEIIRHPGEARPSDGGPGRSCARPGSCEPSKAGVTLGKIINWIRGNDPDPDIQ